jgi:CheY-like chemotaxis protein
MTDKVLFVDDEPAVLEGIKRMLHRDFHVDTAVGGKLALTTIQQQGPYAVVVSDMRMPSMNGAQFLTQVRASTPDTIRMLLTGYSDLDAAMQAVNEGNIFRFLTKPCEKEVLAKALTVGLVQYHLVTAEKELLEKTLMGSIKVLIDVLGAASPQAFGRSLRLAQVVRYLQGKFNLPSAWRFEAAAMLSQLGCITLDPELLESAYMGKSLSPEDQARFDAHPAVARDLLVSIPRLEPIAWMISQQLSDKNTPQPTNETTASASDVAFGAKMLKVAVAFDNLKMKGLSEEDALAKIRERHTEFGLELVKALADFKPESGKMELRKVPASRLTRGMILQQEIRTKGSGTAKGILLATNGQEITETLQIKLDNLSRWGTIDHEVMALVPVVQSSTLLARAASEPS